MKSAIAIMLLLAVTTLPAFARAQEGSKKDSPPAAVPESPPPAAPVDSTKTDAGKSFVDRDGDGIQDGQEFRFRRAWRGTRGTGSGMKGTMRGGHGPGGAGKGGCQ